MISFSVLVSLLSIVEGQDLSQISCQICDETIDHVGNFIAGNPGLVPMFSKMISNLSSKLSNTAN